MFAHDENDFVKYLGNLRTTASRDCELHIPARVIADAQECVAERERNMPNTVNKYYVVRLFLQNYNKLLHKCSLADLDIAFRETAKAVLHSSSATEAICKDAEIIVLAHEQQKCTRDRILTVCASTASVKMSLMCNTVVIFDARMSHYSSYDAAYQVLLLRCLVAANIYHVSQDVETERGARTVVVDYIKRKNLIRVYDNTECPNKKQ